MNQINGKLTPGQVEVLDLIKLGCNNRQIASELGLPIDTVKSRISRIFFHLKARSRTDAIVKAYRAGYIDFRKD